MRSLLAGARKMRLPPEGYGTNEQMGPQHIRLVRVLCLCAKLHFFRLSVHWAAGDIFLFLVLVNFTRYMYAYVHAVPGA